MIKYDAVYTKDVANKKVNVVRSFNAGLSAVWEAWTTAEALDQWWAPRPYKAVTKVMDFAEGGHWLYKMQAPDGSGQWCKVSYSAVTDMESITSSAAFVDEDEQVDDDFPVMHWKQNFSEADGITTVNVDISFDKVEDMDNIMKMGFQEGFRMGLSNLDEYLAGK